MRKLAPARVLYRHDFLISYRVYMIMGHFISGLFEGTLHVDKIHVRYQNRKHYACATRSRPPADRIHTEAGGRFALT